MPARLSWLAQDARKYVVWGGVGLMSVRSHASAGPWAHVWAANSLVEATMLDPFNIATAFPLYLRPEPAPAPTDQLELWPS